jgi:hypothetical protein
VMRSGIFAEWPHTADAIFARTSAR